MSSSQIERIVDYTAMVAGGIEGVKAVAASGQGHYEDPLRAGQMIASAAANPAAAFTHWTELPGAPPLEWVSQSGTVEMKWMVPLRLWLPKGEEAARRFALPFYDRYLRAFVLDRLLGGLALRTEISRFHIGGDADWSWLDVGLMVVERVNYFE